MNTEKLFASFVLDRGSELEIALQADRVIEATQVERAIQTLPTSIEYLEGLQQFRDRVIPVVNLKKRLGLQETGYGDEAKIAVIQVGQKSYGLLFDDIREVLRVDSKAIVPLDATLMSEDTVISDLIVLENGARTLELLDIDRLFPQTGGMDEAAVQADRYRQRRQRHYSRFVVFSCHGQAYGIPVEDAREICFPSDIDDMFKSGVIEGALQLRGSTIPVLASAQLLGRGDSVCQTGGDTRILVMECGELSFGLIVDRIHEILVFPDDEILAIPENKVGYVKGICPCGEDSNVMLLNVLELIDDQLIEIKAMARRSKKRVDELPHLSSTARHVITENCYLVFSIGKNFAIELKDVQEIIETEELMPINENGGLLDGLINLRGNIVPVLDLRRFYHCFDDPETTGENSMKKLIIGKANGSQLALMVDEIVTIYKQEEFHKTPSLRPELQAKKDTLDRLIEFVNHGDVKEHVLVVNVAKILAGHMHIRGCDAQPGQEEHQVDEKTGRTDRQSITE